MRSGCYGYETTSPPEIDVWNGAHMSSCIVISLSFSANLLVDGSLTFFGRTKVSQVSFLFFSFGIIPYLSLDTISSIVAWLLCPIRRCQSVITWLWWLGFVQHAHTFEVTASAPLLFHNTRCLMNNPVENVFSFCPGPNLYLLDLFMYEQHLRL